MSTLRLVASLAAMILLAGPAAVRAQDTKDKEKESAKEKEKAAKAKPPARSYSDEDLKKYKDKPKEEGTGAQAGSTGDAGSGEETVPGQRRTHESGGYQPAPARPSPKASGPGKAPVESAPPEEPTNPEEANWRARAKQAHAPLQAAETRVREIESQIADLRDRLNPMSTKYVLGGNSTAGPGAVYEIEEQIRNLENELGGARTAAAEAEKSWQAFLEDARAAGASPAWLNP